MKLESSGKFSFMTEGSEPRALFGDLPVGRCWKVPVEPVPSLVFTAPFPGR